MKKRRRHIPIRNRLAAALLIIFQIPREHAKKMTVDQILSLAHWDHDPIRIADGGTDEPSNLTPRLIKEHKEKTAKIDAPAMAKDRRIESKWKPFMSAVNAGKKPPKRISRWQNRRKI